MGTRNNTPTAPAEHTKSFYWRNHGMVALQIDDPKLPWDIRELFVQFMTKRYGDYRGIRKPATSEERNR
jgi:hypothetical protein